MGNSLAQVPAANAPAASQPERMNADPFWGSVSKHKFAEFNICTVSRDENGNQTVEVDSSQPTVRAFLTDGDKTMESQWQTPFENSNPELKMPMLMAGLQNGQAVVSLGAAAGAAMGGLPDEAVSAIVSAAQPVAEWNRRVGCLSIVRTRRRARLGDPARRSQRFFRPEAKGAAIAAYLLQRQDILRRINEIASRRT